MLFEISQNSLKTPVPESLFFAEACNFIKKETLAQVFSGEFAIFLRAPFLQNISGATASAQIDPDKIGDHFSVKSCLIKLLGSKTATLSNRDSNTGAFL